MNKSGTSSQIIGLPQGGGALHGIGEKFSPDLHTGTGNFSVPIALPAGRNGFQPDLSLVYSSGNGNGPFGLGWSLNVPGIVRKTSDGLPRYEDQDTFILSGAEDLVPIAMQANQARYRPRSEGLFARIVHHRDATQNYWQVESKDGLTSFYGTPASAGRDPAILADPDNAGRVFAWKLSRTVDAFGNRIDYLYERDTVQNDGPHRWDQVYLSEIRYADYGDPADPQFLVRVKFVYQNRPDPFSEYRSGFEIRTVRRCTQIRIFTHADQARLTRTYHLDFPDRSGNAPLPLNNASLLQQVRVEGHDGALSEFLPPLTFAYSGFSPDNHKFFPVTGELPAGSLARPEYELADLFGNGLPDILEMNGTVRYWRNLGNGRFDRSRNMAEAPAGLQLADPDVQLIDADGDGRVDLMVHRDGLSGYFPRRFNGLWDRKSFQHYEFAPRFNLQDPNVKLLDLTGDGVTDAIRSGDRLECFFNDGQLGWHDTRRIERHTLDDFPNLNFSDFRVKWGDFSGDGLQDMALVHEGRVEYWPNLGYGNWGRRIVMRNSPRLPAGYDPKRILIDDIDGDGLADLVYVDDRKVLLWINQGGNSWSDVIEISGTPSVSDMDAVRLVDLLGSGNRGLLWSKDADGSNRPRMHFLDFCGGVKPYLLNRMNNGLGAVTQVDYAPSTRFYLQDQQHPASRWQAPLPFPVQVVAKVEVIDQISQGKLTTEYSYHHGYWDGAEREFRGFGRVDQRDSELFAALQNNRLYGEQPFDTVAERHFAPPLETRTWFHQGPIGDAFGDWREADFSGEYWSEDPQALFRPAAMTARLNALPRRQKRDALRTLRGSVLRTELYALDGSERQKRPYTVTEALHGLREEMSAPTGSQRRAVFFSFNLAQRSTQWERGTEPMTQLSLMGDYDQYGRLQSQLSIAVPRGRDYRLATDADAEPYLVSYAETVYLQRADAQRYLIDKVAKISRYEIVNDGKSTAFALWEAIKAGSASKQLIGQTLNFYDGPGFQGLPFGQLGDYGALVRSEKLVMPDALLAELYRSGDNVQNPPELPLYLKPGTPAWTDEYPAEFRKLAALAGYVYRKSGAGAISAQGYFAIAASHLYDFQVSGANGKGRGLLLQHHDPLGRRTVVAYDNYQLLPVKVIDPLGLKTEAKYDYRVMQPQLAVDVNNNSQRFRFTPLGLLKATLVQGKANEGDRNRPGLELSYDLLAFSERGQPVSVRSKQYQHHDSDTDIPLPQRDQTIETVEYSDGFGRVLQTRVQSEDIRFGNAAFGGGIVPADQNDETRSKQLIVGVRNSAPDHPNVVVSGWQVYDNKGRAVEKYEPFYGQGWQYNPADDAQLGRKAVTIYDPRGQVVRSVNPDGAEQRVIYGIPAELENPEQFAPTAWEAYTYDANDNAGRTHAGSSQSFQSHWNTPTSIVIDALGRTVQATARNGADLADWYVTLSSYDIRGNLLSVTDPLGRVAFRYGYDLANRPWRNASIDAGLRRTVQDAAGNLLEQRDSKGALILHGYDEGNRPHRLWARDSSNQIMTLRQLLIYGDRPDSGLSVDVAKQKNLLGKLYRHYDEAGLVSVPGYDFKGNPLSQSRQTLSDAVLLSAYQNGGQRNWAIDAYRIDWQAPAGTTLAAHAQTLLDPTVYETTSYFDALNRIKRMQYPKDVTGQRQELLPIYNRAGGLAQVKLNGQLFVQQIAYSAKGQRVLVAYGNGVMSRYAYDDQTFRLLRLRSERFSQPQPDSFQPNGEALQDFAYRYDPVGNILQIEDRTTDSGILNNPVAAIIGNKALAQLLISGNALLRQFAYDPLYRLLSASGRECDQAPETPPWLDQPRDTDLTRSRAYSQHYRYDALGNMQELKHQRAEGNRNRLFVSATGNNRLETMTIGQTIYRYAYDANGNMLSEHQTRLFDWDHSDRLKAFRTQVAGSEPSVHAQYLYDAGGMRVKKLTRKQGGQYTVTVYIGGLFEYHRAVQGTTVQENNTLHVMDDQSRIALVRVGTPFPDDTTPAVKYHLGDHLGSSHIVIGGDGDGVWLNREEYTPYGETSFGSFARKRYRFTGKERDEESGLNYHAARYYAAWLGRWMSADPIGLKAGINLFSYVEGNPLNYFDSSGHDKQEGPILNGTLPEVSDDSDIAGAITDKGENIAKNTATKVTEQADAMVQHQKAQRRTLSNKGKGNLSHHKRSSIGQQNAARAKVAKLTAAAKVAKVIGVVADVVGGTADFVDRAFGDASPATTKAGKVADGALAAGVGTLAGALSPIAMGADAAQEKMLGFKPVPMGDTIKGTSSAAVALIEAVLTGETEGVELIHERMSNNENGWFLRLSSQAATAELVREPLSERALLFSKELEKRGASPELQRAGGLVGATPGVGAVVYFGAKVSRALAVGQAEALKRAYPDIEKPGEYFEYPTCMGLCGHR